MKLPVEGSGLKEVNCVNFARQEAIALDLILFERRVEMQANMVHAYVPDMQALAERLGRDVVTLIAADVLKVDYHDVMPIERAAAEWALFVQLYVLPRATAVRIGDSLR